MHLLSYISFPEPGGAGGGGERPRRKVEQMSKGWKNVVPWFARTRRIVVPPSGGGKFRCALLSVSYEETT